MKGVLLLVSLIVLIGGYGAFGREYGAAYFARSSDFAILENLSSDAQSSDAQSSDAQSSNAKLIRLPYSARGMREVFEICGGLQSGIIYALQPREVQQVIDRKCLTLAENALRTNPTYGAAHTIKMMSLEHPQDIRAAMILSQKTSATESWDAKLRLAKSAAIYNSGHTDFDAALRDDITFLVQSDGGRAWLASLYNRTPAVRDIFTKTIEARPGAEKADFLQKVRTGD